MIKKGRTSFQNEQFIDRLPGKNAIKEIKSLSSGVGMLKLIDYTVDVLGGTSEVRLLLTVKRVPLV